MASNLLRVSSVAVYSEDAGEMKDQLCTLLITFTDGGDPTKQITTTHTFVSTDPRHYPQQRTVGWSDWHEKDVEENADQRARPRVTTLFRAAQTPLGEVGEDMIEQERRTSYHLKPTLKQYSTSPSPQKRSRESESERSPKGLPRTDAGRLTKVEESGRTIDQYNKKNARPTQPSLNTSTKSVPVRVAERARLLNEKAKEEAVVTSRQHKLSKSTETLQSSGKKSEMLPPHRHQARSYESIHESFERNNQHTQISYQREVSEFKTKLPTEGRRLPRHSEDFHVYQRYDGTPRNVDKPEPKKRQRGQYIREEFHTEEHYVVTRTPMLGKQQTEEKRFSARDQQPAEKGTQELKIEIEDKKPQSAGRKEEDAKQMRFIDYNEYESEVRRLQEQASHTEKPGQISTDAPPLVPLTPAIVLPASRKEPTIGHKSRAASDLQTTYYSRTTEKRDHTSRSPIPPRISPTPMSTSVQGDRSFASESDEQRRIQELAAESFQEKIEILKTSKRFRPSGSPHSDSYMVGGSPSPRHYSPATTRRADSSQHSDTFSSPAPHTVTSFPATPLPDYTRETPPLSSSTPPPQPIKSGVRGVLTKETTHEFITDIVEERKVQKAKVDEPKLPKIDESRTTVFPIHDDTALIVEPKHLATGETQTATESIAERVKKEEEERRYRESLKQNLSYEEQVELEIQKRRRRGENDEMQPELLSIVDEEEELTLHEDRPAINQPVQETLTRTEENTVVTTKRIYIDTIRDAYLGPLHLLGRQTDLNHIEFEPKLPPKPIEKRNVATQQDLPVPIKQEEDERSFDERIETEIKRRMAHVGDRTRDPSYYEPKKLEPEKPTDRSTISEHSTVTTTTTTKTVQKTSTDDRLKPTEYSYYKAQPAPLPKMESRAEYRSNISSRANNLSRPQRTMSPIGSQGFSNTGNRVLKILTESSSVGSGFSPYGSSMAATTIRDTREREKKEMSDLNDRLASYIEKVRFLEAQNRKLATDLAYLQNRWGQDSTSVRDMYEGDLRQAKRVLEEMEKLRRDLLEECRSLQDDINNYRRNYDEAVRLRELSKDQLDELLVKLSGLESELNLLKRRIANLETDVGAIKRENQQLISSLQRARIDLDQETLNRIDYQNQAQTLLEEIEFLRRAHDSEINDLQDMVYKDTTTENRELFRNELANAIRDIRTEYDQLNASNRTDMESWYKLKVSEIQTQSARQNMEQSYAAEEIKRLRSQLSDLRGKLADLEGRNAILEKNLEELNFQLEDDQRNYESALNDRDTQIRKIRDECQMLMVELQMLLDTKQTLDAEIAIYRKMLEGEEDRAGLRQLVEQVVRTHHHKHGDESESLRVIRGETSSRHSYQRSAKGNVSIHEASPDGRYIILENTHRSREEHIGEWKLKRRIDNRRDIVYTFPHDFVLAPGKSVKIWAHNQGIASPPDQLVFKDEDSFGVGNNVQTILYNTQGEERATLIQRSSQV